jgi:hypothetical protein
MSGYGHAPAGHAPYGQECAADAMESVAMSCGTSCLIAAWHRANRQGEEVRAITVSVLPGCSATVDGTSATAHNGLVKAAFSNKADALKVLATGGNLHLYNPTSGCGTAFSNGDAVNFTASYKLSPKQTITSP